MPNLNACQFMGNLTRDPETKFTPKGTAVTQIGLAINRVWRNDAGEKMEEVTFLDISYFGKQAETIAEYCKKGDPIYVEGRLKLDSWDDKTTGQKRYALKIIGESFQFLAGKREGDAPQKQERPPQQRPERRPAPPRDPDLDTQEEDGLPF